MPDPKAGDLKAQRLDDFESLYANNVFLESSAWDLRMIFGQVDLQQNTVFQFGSIAIPWAQAKILAYLLQVHLVSHEGDYGRIHLPPNAVLEIPAEKPKSLEGVTPEQWAKLRKLYEQFVAANPEINPSFKHK